MQTIRASRSLTFAPSLAERRRLLGLVWDWRLPLLLGLLALLLTLAAQVPVRKTIHLGEDDGPLRANAFAFDFYPPERQGDAEFRWSSDHGRLVFPGVGAQDVGVRFEVLAHRAQFIDPERPTVLRVDINGTPVEFALRRERAQYHILVPESFMAGGTLDMILHTEPWQAPGDSRSGLGFAMGEVAISGLGAFGTRGPVAAVLASWLVALLVCWPVGRLVGFSPNQTLALLGLLALVPVVATAGAPAYLALGNRALLVATAWGVLLALLLHLTLPPLLRRLGIRPDPVLVRWLLLIMVVSFIVKYGGRIYPGSMHGDLELHWHRFIRTMGGSVHIMAAHRGLPFPFPGALYIVMAPFGLLGIPTWMAFEWWMALCEATTPLLIALIGARALGSLKVGVVGGAVYALMAGGVMTTWFAFETHIFAQWATLLLWTLLIFCWPGGRGQGTGDKGLGTGGPVSQSPVPNPQPPIPQSPIFQSPWLVSLLVLVQCWVYLGHTGFLINTVTLFAAGLPLLLWAAWNSPLRRAALQVVGVVLLGGLVAAGIYYTAFFGLILTQLGGVASVGLLEVTGRRPVEPSEVLRHIWEDGILTHYGFFPLPLALCGLGLIMQKAKGKRQHGETAGQRSATSGEISSLSPRRVLFWLILLTFLVSLSQGLLPLFTRSTLTTRYLMFAIWAVALASAPALLRFWRRGPAGKLVVALMALFVAWGTFVIWAGALALNIGPPEPF